MAVAEKLSFRHEIRNVAHGLTDAEDRRILEVVAMLDAMPERGQADLIIAPLRARLARLRPPRPLRFARLMFLPLDPLIVPAQRWRPDRGTIPRTAIPAMAAATEASLGPLTLKIASLIEGRTTGDPDVVEAAGALLWPAAAAILMEAANPPPGWDTTGLAHHFYRPLALRGGALLSQAARLLRLETDAALGSVPLEFKTLHALLTETAAFDSGIQPMAIALLFARLPEAAPILSKMAQALGFRGEAMLRQAGEVAATILLDQMEAPGGAEARLGGRDLTEASITVHRLVSLLSVLDGGAMEPARRERLRGLRRRIHAGCLSLFTGHLSSEFLEPLRAAGPYEAWALEAAARDLRALETEARRMGGGGDYDLLLNSAAGTVRDAAARGGLSQMNSLRLMELLAGPDTALAMLDEKLAGAKIGT